MFNKLLIANRGEIACRIIQAARQLGIPTVAVYSDADQYSLHAELADEAVAIGAPSALDSYLNIRSIVEASMQLGVDAIHPGYGFLSENAEFVIEIEEAGINFIGPSVHAIKLMGDKIASKKLAASIGVPVIPGHDGSIADTEEALARAEEIGYPVMLKASAGGGGKGLRIAFDSEECMQGFERARSEAAASFSDPRILIEKYIVRPRHIEIQVIGDKYGNCVHLGERECSIQRRHQKVIEESPSPFVDEPMRRAMGEQALSLAKAVDYFSVGTVEFVVDFEGRFYFLEMNTRLQVEHPVTEMTTNLDLVELMLRIADGEPLPFTQSDVESHGWAIESRIYAEDPYRDFLPQTGRIYRYRHPPETKALRVDTGVREGDEISIYYDPMLAKLITHGKSRREAIAAMIGALDQFCVDGVITNIPLLSQIMRHSEFARGTFSTQFFEEEYPDGFTSALLDPKERLCVVVLAATLDHYESAKRNPEQVRGTLRRNVRVQNTLYETKCWYTGSEYNVEIDLTKFLVKLKSYIPQAQVSFEINGQLWFARVRRSKFRYHIFLAGIDSLVTVLPPEVDVLYPLMPKKQTLHQVNYIVAPMPGLLVSLSARPGQKVRSGDQLAVIEAMKMENSLRAEHDSVITEILAAEGQALEKGQAIIRFKEDG